MFRARDLLVRQRTQCVNALRGHLMEYGYVFPKGITHVETLVALVEDLPSSLPDSVRVILKLFVDTFTALEAQITALYAEINQRSKSDPTARRAPHSIQHYRLLASAWKHFEGLPRLPRGVVCALRECSANSPAPARHAPFGTAGNGNGRIALGGRQSQSAPRRTGSYAAALSFPSVEIIMPDNAVLDFAGR